MFIAIFKCFSFSLFINIIIYFSFLFSILIYVNLLSLTWLLINFIFHIININYIFFIFMCLINTINIY